MLQPSHITFTDERTFMPLEFDGNIAGRKLCPPLATVDALSRANKGVTRSSRNIQSHMSSSMVAKPTRRLWSVVVFCFVLVAFVAESELTQVKICPIRFDSLFMGSSMSKLLSTIATRSSSCMASHFAHLAHLSII